MKIYRHLFVQIADYLALAFHMLGTIPTEKLFIHGNPSNGMVIISFFGKICGMMLYLSNAPFTTN